MSKKRFFNIEHGHILYTNNKWKDVCFGQTKSAVNDKYEKETDNTVMQKAILRYKYGDQTAQLIIEEFNRIDSVYYSFSGHHLNTGNGYGDHFEIFAIATLYDASYEKTITDYLVNGSDDGGVDAIYYDSSNAIIIQIKIDKLTDDNAIEYMTKAIDEYENSHTINDPIKKDLKKFLDKHYDKDICGKNISYLTISSNSLRPENIKPETIYNDFIGKTIERSKLFFKNNIEIFKNSKKESVVYQPDENHKEIFLFANADKLIETLNKHIESEDNIDYLFVDNVRGRLKRNTTIVQTIKNEPMMFSFYNNGISIVGQFETQEKSSKIVVYNPIIINGQQTVMSLFSAKKDGDDLSKVYVPVFLKSVADEKELRKIAKYNNSQTKISSLDLLSIDANLRKIQSELLSTFIEDKKAGKECFYLDIVRNGKNKHKDKAKQLFDKEHIILVGDFVKLYSSVKDLENLGSWKNAMDANINKEYKNGFDYVEVSEAWKICKAIYDSKRFVGKNNDFRIADLIIQFLIYYNYTFEQIESIINQVNTDSDNNNIARASVYKKNGIIDIIKNVMTNLNIDIVFDNKTEVL